MIGDVRVEFKPVGSAPRASVRLAALDERVSLVPRRVVWVEWWLRVAVSRLGVLVEFGNNG